MIYILVGMPGSGKSRFARSKAEAGALVVCHDDLARMLHAGVNVGGRGYDLELRATYHAIEDAMAWHAYLAGRDVVIDRTHLTRESRRRWLDCFGANRDTLDPGPKLVAVEFPRRTAWWHACTRFEADPRGRTLLEWVAVAERHESAAEPVLDDEGFSHIHTVEWTNE